MFLNMHPKKIVKIVFCILLLQTMMPNFTSLNAQVQSHQSTVIDFLSRMAQKGKIEFNDFIKPVDRKIIFQKLEELQNQKDLSEIEQKELQFFNYAENSEFYRANSFIWASLLQFLAES